MRDPEIASLVLQPKLRSTEEGNPSFRDIKCKVHSFKQAPTQEILAEEVLLMASLIEDLREFKPGSLAHPSSSCDHDSTTRA